MLSNLAAHSCIHLGAMFRCILGPQPGKPLGGRGWHSRVLANLGLPQSAEFEALVARARKMLDPVVQNAGQRQRPKAKLRSTMRHTADGGSFVKDPALRLVDEEENKSEHVRKAKAATFPEQSKRYTLSAECSAAAKMLVRASGDEITRMRRTQIRALEKLAAPCQRISRQWKAHFSRVPDGVRELRASFNVAFLAVLMEAMDWPDVGLCRCLLEGFPLAGNLADRDSGLFRLKEGERKAEEMATFQKGYASIRSHSENVQWVRNCEEILLNSARAAEREGEKGSGSRDAALLRGVFQATLDQEAQGFVGPAMDTETLLREFTVDGTFQARPLPRFGIYQGWKTDEQGVVSRKLRCIDDGKRAGVNAATFEPENLVMPTFEFPARVGFALAELNGGKPPFGLLLGLEDMFAAYRRFGTSTPWATVIGVYNPQAESRAVEWRQVKGMPMGLSASPLSFCRLPTALCAIAQVWCAVCVESFVDDYIIVDRNDAPIEIHDPSAPAGAPPRAWTSSGQWCLNRIHDLAGIGLEPKKQKPAATENELLGVLGDLADYVPHGRIRFSATRKRRSEIIASMDEARREGKLRPRQAASMLGRLNFALSAAYTSVGRAATQPLVDRANKRHEGRGRNCRNPHRWTPSMTHMLAFFRELFEHLPPVEFVAGKASRNKVVVYTDASLSSARNGIGIVIFDQETNESFRCDSPCPAWLMRAWNDGSTNPWLLGEYKERDKRIAHVNALELLAIVAAVWTFGPAFFSNRQVVFFCDSTAAMSAAVHGYARAPHLAALANTLHLAMARLRCQAWFEWVPSEANPADLPSRPQGKEAEDFYKKESLKLWPVAMRFPSMAQLSRPRFHDVSA